MIGTGADIAACIDWSRHGPVTTTNHCRCGAEYRSHHKLKMDGPHGPVGVTKDACPRCGSHVNIWRSSSDPERFVLSGTAE